MCTAEISKFVPAFEELSSGRGCLLPVRSLPYEKFYSLTLGLFPVIEAKYSVLSLRSADPTFQSGIIAMSKSVRDVVDFISNQGHLRQLEICFSGINDMWKIGSGYRNYSSYRKMGDPAPSLDLEIALLPPCRLRNIGRVSIDLQLLFGYNDGTIALAKECEKIMMSTQPFGTVVDKSWMTDRLLQGDWI